MTAADTEIIKSFRHGDFEFQIVGPTYPVYPELGAFSREGASFIRLYYEGELMVEGMQFCPGAGVAIDSMEAMTEAIFWLNVKPGDGHGVEDDFWDHVSQKGLDFYVEHGMELDEISSDMQLLFEDDEPIPAEVLDLYRDSLEPEDIAKLTPRLVEN